MHDLKIFTNNVDPSCLNQIYELLNSPCFIGSKTRIMPDVHSGAGCVVGFTSTLSDKIIPNVIGVDIGCGMLTCKFKIDSIDFCKLDDFIKQKIPSGSDYSKEVDGENFINELYCKNNLRDMNRLLGSLGTLGGGNHFIEIDKDDEGNFYLIIHSGSRNLGLQVAKIYQKIAIDDCKKCADIERNLAIEKLKAENNVTLIPATIKAINEKYASKTKTPNEFCYLEGANMQKYLHDVAICQQFASENRKKMAKKILNFLGVNKFTQFETVHNFIDQFGVIRKGAVPSRKGELILIPMNMRDGCLVCEGLGNDDWNCSAPHGAGRLLSRSEAKSLISTEEFSQSMKGIFTTTANQSTLDEAPMAYKPMEQIIELIKPTCKILQIIKPVYNFKASE